MRESLRLLLDYIYTAVLLLDTLIRHKLLNTQREQEEREREREDFCNASSSSEIHMLYMLCPSSNVDSCLLGFSGD